MYKVKMLQRRPMLYVYVELAIFLHLIAQTLCMTRIIAHRKSGRSLVETHARAHKFVVYWNAPTQRCFKSFGIDVDVGKYGIITNIKDGWKGENITIFPRLGLYPVVAKNGSVLNGGIPQNVDLGRHKEQIKQDIMFNIPDKSFNGLAIVDYEGWQPAWSMNFDTRVVYKIMSMELVRKQHPQWAKYKILTEAERQFNYSSREFLELTMRTAQSMRPAARWGYYHYPYCFNGDKFNGVQCSKLGISANDKLYWLFEAEKTLYPSAYLHSSDNFTLNGLFVQARLEEAERIHKVLSQKGKYMPMYLYVALRYTFTQDFYKVEDLNNTINRALTMGLDGVVLWGDHNLSKDKDICKRMKIYVDDILGPYVNNIL